MAEEISRKQKDNLRGREFGYTIAQFAGATIVFWIWSNDHGFSTNEAINLMYGGTFAATIARVAGFVRSAEI